MIEPSKLPTGAIHVPAPDSVPHATARARFDQMTVQQSVDWHKAAPADGDMIGNDLCGNCVQAWDYQEIRLRRANSAGDTWKPTQADAIGRYSYMTGYNPITGQPDVGTSTAADTLDFCTKGIRINPQLLDIPHWALLDPANVPHMKIAIAQFGPIAWTFNLPRAWQNLNWSVAPGSGPDWVPGSWEPGTGVAEHRVGSGKYDGDWFTLRTYGRDLVVHPEALKRYLIGAEVRISRDWCETTGLAPSGLNFDELMADRLRLAP